MMTNGKTRKTRKSKDAAGAHAPLECRVAILERQVAALQTYLRVTGVGLELFADEVFDDSMEE